MKVLRFYAYYFVGYSVQIEYNSTLMSSSFQVHLLDGDAPPLIYCVSNANQRLNLTWSRDARRLPLGIEQSYEFVPGKQILQLRWTRNVRASDVGSYLCSSSNTFGEITRVQFTLILKSKLELLLNEFVRNQC